LMAGSASIASFTQSQSIQSKIKQNTYSGPGTPLDVCMGIGVGRGGGLFVDPLPRGPRDLNAEPGV